MLKIVLPLEIYALQMRRTVMVNAEQTPQYSDVRNAGHDGGDLLFVRKKQGPETTFFCLTRKIV